MTRSRSRALAILFAVTLVVSLAAGQEPAAATGQSTAEASALDAIRADVVGLKFEQALVALEALLARPGLAEGDRAEALVLRTQALVALGDLDAAASDYREILAIRPGYRPDATLTPKKALQRFESVRAEVVGVVELTVDPREARLQVDGSPVQVPADGRLAVRAGAHRFSATLPGYDPRSESLEVAAGATVPLDLTLTPNARTVIIRTVPPGVDVLLDGALVGRTERPETDAETTGLGELRLPNVPLGEHLFVLRRECFRDERLRDVLSVDMLDRGPKLYRTTVMTPAKATVTVRGAPDGARVLVDGAALGTTPLAAATVCPGERPVEVRRGTRPLWRSTETFADTRETIVDVTPRPNAVLVGADEWPRDLVEFGSAFNLIATLEAAPAGPLDESVTWERIDLPVDTDLVLAVVRSTRPGAPDVRVLYSPILRRAVRLDAAPEPIARPTWRAVTWGLTVADSTVGGPALVVRVDPGGPAQRAGLAPGDRIVGLGGREVADAARVRATLAAAAAGRPLEVVTVTGAGERVTAALTGADGPRLIRADRDDVEAAVHAAWALVDADVLGGPLAAPALSNLALLFDRAGHPDLAAATWRRVVWGERRGVGTGTGQYYLGVALQRTRDESGAVAALRAAAASQAVTGTDDGPRVAPAARDRLADLGVAVNAR